MRLSKLLLPVSTLALVACGDPQEVLPSKPVLYVDRLKLEFNTEFDRGTYVGQTTFNALYIENRGLQPLELSKVEKSGRDASFFTLELPEPLKSGQTLTLPSRATTAVQVAFRPNDDRAFAAELTLTSNDPDRPSFKVELAGLGINP
jgi:hypothetical protein